MIHYVLFCILWAKPQTELFEVPVNEYAMADMNREFGEFQFEASIFEEKMNYVKITHLPTKIMTEANSSANYQQRSLYNKLDVGTTEGSLDCEMRSKPQEEKVK